MNYKRVLENDTEVLVDEGLVADPFSFIYEDNGASLSCTVGRAHPEYSRVKCSVTVSLKCPQTEALINKAGELAFKKALELTNDGMSYLAPDLPAIEYEHDKRQS